MIPASKEFKEKLKRDRVPLANYADATLSDGTVLHLEPKDFRIGGCTIEDKTTDGGKFGVGFVVGKTLSIRLENQDERFSKYDFFNSIIYMYVAMLLDNGTVEKIRKGVYYTLVPETPGDAIEISAVDGMYKLDKDYSASTIYPATLQTIITDACIDCGIPVGFRQFDNMDFIVEEKPDKGTYRQIISWACQIAGYNARIDNDGYMQLVWYNTDLLDRRTYDGGRFNDPPADTILDGGKFGEPIPNMIIDGGNFADKSPEHIFRIKSLNVSTDDVMITGVRVINGEEKNVLFGEEGYLIEISENPFASGKEEEVADYLGRRMVGIVFRPFSAEALGNPLYEPFDVVKVSDRKGNPYISILNSISYTIGSYTHVACEAEDPVRNGSTYVSAAAQAVVEARRNTEKQLTTYDKAVQNMNQLAMNAMGYHTTYEDQPDGSRITYLHDEPTLEESTIIYKQTIDGFFLSQDGGKSYTAGFDKFGNAVLNVIHAMSIYANQITAGRFEVKKGDKLTFLADVDTGDVRIVADYFSLSSGQTIESIAEDKSDTALRVAKEYANGELTAYSSKVNSSLKVINDSISAEVTRATRAEGVLDGNIKTVDQTLSSKIEQTAESITSTVSETYETKSNASTQYSSLSSQITQTANQISLKVSKGDVSSEISAETGKVFIGSNRLEVDSTNFKLDSYGNVSITGTFSSKKGSEWLKIDESVITGGYSSTTDGLLDLSAQYGGNDRRVVLEAKTSHMRLIIPTGKEIEFAVGSTRAGYIDSSGIHGNMFPSNGVSRTIGFGNYTVVFTNGIVTKVTYG